MDGVIFQDNLVEQVKKANDGYKESFDIAENSLQKLLDKWEGKDETTKPSENNVVAVPTSENSPVKGRHLEWNKVKEPSNPIALRAVEQYQAQRQKQIEKKNKARMEEAKKKQKQDRLNS